MNNPVVLASTGHPVIAGLTGDLVPFVMPSFD